MQILIIRIRLIRAMPNLKSFLRENVITCERIIFLKLVLKILYPDLMGWVLGFLPLSSLSTGNVSSTGIFKLTVSKACGYERPSLNDSFYF